MKKLSLCYNSFPRFQFSLPRGSFRYAPGSKLPPPIRGWIPQSVCLVFRRRPTATRINRCAAQTKIKLKKKRQRKFCTATKSRSLCVPSPGGSVTFHGHTPSHRIVATVLHVTATIFSYFNLLRPIAIRRQCWMPWKLAMEGVSY